MDIVPDQDSFWRDLVKNMGGVCGNGGRPRAETSLDQTERNLAQAMRGCQNCLNIIAWCKSYAEWGKEEETGKKSSWKCFHCWGLWSRWCREAKVVRLCVLCLYFDELTLKAKYLSNLPHRDMLYLKESCRDPGFRRTPHFSGCKAQKWRIPIFGQPTRSLPLRVWVNGIIRIHVFCPAGIHTSAFECSVPVSSLTTSALRFSKIWLTMRYEVETWPSEIGGINYFRLIWANSVGDWQNELDKRSTSREMDTKVAVFDESWILI